MIRIILKKDLKLFFYDKKGVLLTFIMPILLITLFAFAFGATGKKNHSNPIELLVSDMDDSNHSNQLISSIDSLKGVRLVSKEVQMATESVNKGKYVGVLIIGKGFQDSVAVGNELPLELKYDAARELEIGMLQSVLIQRITKSIGSKHDKIKIKNYFDNNFSNLSPEIQHLVMEDMDSDKSLMNTFMNGGIQLKMTSISKVDQGNPSLIQAVAGTAIMMLLFSIAGIGGGLLDEKEAGTLKRLLFAPVSPTKILFAKLATAMIVSVFQLMVMFVYSWLVFGLPIFLDLLSLIMMILATSFAVASFGLFLVAIAKSRTQLQGYSTIIIMLMSAIGGSMIPLFIMPAIMQKIAVVSVNYWGIQGFFDIFWRKLPLEAILPKMGILIGIGLVMTLFSIPLFRRNILKMV